VPRRTWLDQKVDALLEELAASGMDLDRQRAGELITDRVRAVAALMRVTAPTPPGPEAPFALIAGAARSNPSAVRSLQAEARDVLQVTRSGACW
jgi:hypothetical protein